MFCGSARGRSILPSTRGYTERLLDATRFPGQHKARTHQENERKTIVFVVGTARSGTTAMVRLLNSHSRICIGMERFKYVKKLRGNEFDKKKFFSFSPKETNILPKKGGQWERFYADLESRFDQSKAIGDKFGTKPGTFQRILSVYPEARFIHIVRSIDRVAASWNARAADKKDHWPPTADYRAAVPRWNMANREALEAIDHGLPVTVIDYEKFYSNQSDIDGLLEFLTVTSDLSFQENYKASCKFFTDNVLGKELKRLSGEEEYIAEHADLGQFTRLKALAL
jgi:hypothetical protein